MDARETVTNYFRKICGGGEPSLNLIQYSYRERGIPDRIKSMIRERNDLKKSLSRLKKDDDKTVLNSKIKFLDDAITGLKKALPKVLAQTPEPIKAMIKLKPYRFMIVEEKVLGRDMIKFNLVLHTRHQGTLKCTPNVIRENNTWGVNPVSAIPKRGN